MNIVKYLGASWLVHQVIHQFCYLTLFLGLRAIDVSKEAPRISSKAVRDSFPAPTLELGVHLKRKLFHHLLPLHHPGVLLFLNLPFQLLLLFCLGRNLYFNRWVFFVKA